MATAVAKKQTNMVEKEVQRKVVKLELSEEEAKFWYSLTGHIGGSPDTSYRKHSNSFAHALREAGISADWNDYVSRGSIIAKECK